MEALIEDITIVHHGETDYKLQNSYWPQYIQVCREFLDSLASAPRGLCAVHPDGSLEFAFTNASAKYRFVADKQMMDLELKVYEFVEGYRASFN